MAGPKRGGASKVWIVLGVLVVAALAIGLSIKLFSSKSSTGSAKNTTNSSAPSSSPNAVTPNFKPIGKPANTVRNVFKVAVHPTQLRLVSTATESTTILALNPSPDGAKLQYLEERGKASSSVAISPDGKFVAAGDEDGTIELFNVDDMGFTIRSSLTRHKDYVFVVVFTPDSSKLISASADKTVRVWNVSSGQEEKQLQIGEDELIITIDPNQMRAAIFTQTSGQVRIRSINDAAATSSFDNRHAEVTSGAFSPNGETLALGTSDGKVQVWSIPDGTFIREMQGTVRGEVGSVAFTTDGQYLAIGWNNGDIELRRASDGATIQILKGHTRVVRTLSFSRDGRTLASGAEDKTIRLWQY